MRQACANAQTLPAQFPITLVCRVLRVSRSAFYRWQAGESHRPGEDEKAQPARVKQVFTRHKRRYGNRRIVAEPKQNGWPVGRDRVRALMYAP